MKVLSNDSMRPNRLERHLKQPYSGFEDEIVFSSKAKSLKRLRLDKSIILEEDAEQKIKSIPLSHNTVKHRIDNIASDIKSQIINKVKLSPLVAMDPPTSLIVHSYEGCLLSFAYGNKTTR
ncbi:unnamed protein product [Acanthoscelides obtectus]|uniref:Uncharacterized protein n=1 Tax=Acanthoscelides obtectus TaxID=200917 RepID=A0A9P0NZ45_ACAOB|nr:unnamed protein product [Acanthoscelides obtectus]CAK1679195.1 hypothetical protein AOBTE_LOCUS32164 [Acanthoscelides obtectus]